MEHFNLFDIHNVKTIDELVANSDKAQIGDTNIIFRYK